MLGLATDEVEAVTVTLIDGRTATRAAVANFYFVPWPSNARPWDAVEVAARLKDGTVYREHVEARTPAGITAGG